MKVIILTEAGSWGGLEVHSVALARTLVEAGHETSIVCIGDRAYGLYRDRVPADVCLIDLGLPRRRSAWQWWRALAGIRADAAVLEKGTLWTGSTALDVILRYKCRRYIAVQHAPPPDLPPRTSRRYLGGLVPGLGLWWFRWKGAGWLRSLGPQFTVCVSESVRARLRSDYHFRAKRLVTILNGVDPDTFRPDSDNRRRVRDQWRVPDDGFVFGSVGRLTHPKGLDVGLEALALVAAQFPTRYVFLVLVGDGEERQSLAASARRLRIEDRVLFRGFSSSPAEFYQGFDVFILPSRFEGLPFSLVEAMASGCEVLATRVGGIPEVITSQAFGTLVPPSDVEALARAMSERLVASAAERAAISRAAREHVMAHFSQRESCRQTMSVLLGEPA